MQNEHLSRSDAETKEIAKELVESLPEGALICLYGDLGAGKTVFVKGLAQALGIPEKSIKSPTFTVLREYPLEKGTLYHYDLYRQDELDYLLLDQLNEHSADENNFVFVEWAQRMKELPRAKRVISVHIEAADQPDFRRIKVIRHE